MNPYLVFVCSVILVGYLLDLGVSFLNLRALDPRLPEEFAGVFDDQGYARSQEYTRTTARFAMIQETIITALTLIFILSGGFNWVDRLARGFGLGSIATGLVFTAMLLIISGLAGLPFSVYATFVIENRFGFNKTTVFTYVMDRVKGLILTALIGSPVLALILWFFEKGGSSAWIYCWTGIVCVMLFLQWIAPAVIMPWFNRFTPIEEGELKSAILTYATTERFKIKGIYTMDGSRRSTKLNAFFTGFGKFRRIVFFFFLLEHLTTEEIIAVLAHEMGHYKKRHIFKMLTVSILQMGTVFLILSFFINNPGLFAAFKMDHLSIYASLIFFGFLYSPISTLLSIGINMFSRRHEYQADRYARSSTGKPENLISALKKLSKSNLSNLTPHPLHVFMNYSHPPVLMRIRALRQG